MFAAGDLHVTSAGTVIEDALEELCSARAITDPAIRRYLAAKLAVFWTQGARTKSALVAIVSCGGAH